jgi:hypothetical protein
MITIPEENEIKKFIYNWILGEGRSPSPIALGYIRKVNKVKLEALVKTFIKKNQLSEEGKIYLYMNLIKLYKDILDERNRPVEKENGKEIPAAKALNERRKERYFMPTETYEEIIKWLELEHTKLKPDLASNKIEKLRWLGTPSQFGFIFNELAERGFIEIPKTHGKESISKFANICYALFEIEATPGNLAKELNPNKCTLSNTNRKFFKFPNITDL